MSPHGMAGPLDRSSPNSGYKCPLARPLTLPNFVTLRQNVCEISAAENFRFRISAPKFSKIVDDLLRTNASRHAKFCLRSAKRYMKKALQNISTPFSRPILACHGDLLGQSSSLLALMYGKAPVSTCQISSRSENCTRYLLPKFVDLLTA